MENARAWSREWAKGINATLIEAVLVDCDMLTQLCRKYNALPINSVYLIEEKNKASVHTSERDHFFFFVIFSTARYSPETFFVKSPIETLGGLFAVDRDVLRKSQLNIYIVNF